MSNGAGLSLDKELNLALTDSILFTASRTCANFSLAFSKANVADNVDDDVAVDGSSEPELDLIISALEIFKTSLFWVSFLLC